MVAFICTVLVGLAAVAGVLLYGRRRPVGAPLSWGEAMVGALVTMFLFLIMLALPIKMYLRWLFNLKYIIAIPEFFFNI